MAVVIPPGFAQASIEHWLDNYTRPAVTTWGFGFSGIPDGDPNELADRFQDAYTTAFGSLTDTTVKIRNTRVVIGQDGGEPLIGQTSTITAGTSTRESLPPALALMIAKNTGLGGRRNRGRVYIPWAVSEGSVSEQGAVNATTLNSWNAAAGVFLEFFDGSDPFLEGLYVLHGPGLGTPTPITSLSVNPVIRTQKQRQSRF